MEEEWDLERAFDEAWDAAASEAQETQDRPPLDHDVEPAPQPSSSAAQCATAAGPPRATPRRSRKRAAGAAAAAPPPPSLAPEPPSTAPLLTLPREMLLRCLSLVPATGLTCAAGACRALRQHASEDFLWRRLYMGRWGRPGSQPTANAGWKRAYLDADAEEWEATRSAAGQPGPGEDPFAHPGAAFLTALLAKRHTPPDRRQLDCPVPSDPADIGAKLAAWRRARGFADAPAGGGGGGGGSVGASTSGGAAGVFAAAAPRPDLSHRGRAAVTFTRVNPGQSPPVYACDQTGWVHVCGEACTEGQVDVASRLLVCPVSGQTSDVLVHECELEAEEAEGGRGGGAFGEEDGGLGVFGGGFGSFFVAGYECENESALNRLLGCKAL